TLPPNTIEPRSTGYSCAATAAGTSSIARTNISFRIVVPSLELSKERLVGRRQAAPKDLEAHACRDREHCVRILDSRELDRGADQEAAEAETGTRLCTELALRVVELHACHFHVHAHVVVRRLRVERDISRRAERQRRADTNADRDRQKRARHLIRALTGADRRVLCTCERADRESRNRQLVAEPAAETAAVVIDVVDVPETAEQLERDRAHQVRIENDVVRLGVFGQADLGANREARITDRNAEVRLGGRRARRHEYAGRGQRDDLDCLHVFTLCEVARPEASWPPGRVVYAVCDLDRSAAPTSTSWMTGPVGNFRSRSASNARHGSRGAIKIKHPERFRQAFVTALRPAVPQL